MCGGSISRVDWQQLQLAGALVSSFCTIAGDFGCLNWWQLSWASSLPWGQSWFHQVPLHNFRCFAATAKTTSEFIASIAIMTCVTIMHTRHTCQATVILRQRLFIYLFLDTVITSATTQFFKSLIVQEWWEYLGGEFKFTLLKLLSDNVAALRMRH